MPAVDLDVLRGHVEVRLGRVRLDQRGQHRDLLGVLGHRRRRVRDRRPQRLHLQQQVGAAVLDGLEAADRPPELVPDLGVLHRHVQGPLRPAELLGGQRDRGHVQHPVKHRGRVAGRADQPCRGSRRTPAGPASGSGPASAARVRCQAGRVPGHREQRQPAVGDGGHQDQPGRGAVQDEALVPVQPPVLAVLGRGQPDRGRVPGPVLLGERQRGDGLAGRDAGQQSCRAPSSGLASSAVAASTALARYGPPYKAAPSSSSTMACSAKLNPAPPYSSGMAMPCRPSCAPAWAQTSAVRPVRRLHQLADPRDRRPVGQEPADRGPQLLLLLADTEHHEACSIPMSRLLTVALVTTRTSSAST